MVRKRRKGVVPQGTVSLVAGWWQALRREGAGGPAEAPGRGRARMVFEGLEPRLLLSADLVPVVPTPLIDQSLTRADSAAVTISIQNLGDSIVTAPVRVSIFASADATHSANDVLLGSGVLAANSLGAGGAAPLQITLAPVQVPAAGGYTLFAVVDSDQASTLR